MNPIRTLRLRAGLTQAEIARAVGTSQPAIAAYETGRRSPTLRTLQAMARALGFDITVAFVPPLTREDRRSLMLHEEIAARLTAEPEDVLARARRNLRRMESSHPDAAPLLGEWRTVLGQSVGGIAELLVDPRPHARDLRQVTPFAGVLSAAERAAVYGRFRRTEQAA